MVFWFLLCLSAVGGIVYLQQLPVLATIESLLQLQFVLIVLGVISIVIFKKRGDKRWLMVLSCIFVFLLSLSYGTWRAQLRLADTLDKQHDDRVSRLLVEVSDLVDYGEDFLQFDGRVIASKPSTGIAEHIRVRWSFGSFQGPYKKAPPLSEPMPEIKAGEVWEISALMRRPYGAFNPGQRDFLSYRFANNHRATATVKGRPNYVGESEHFSWSIKIARLRHHIRKKLNHYLHDKRYGAVIIALVMGDQAGISQDDWVLFNRSGLTHLVSISGSHITMLSSLASLMSFVLLRRLRIFGKLFSERIAAQRIAATVGIFVAWFYCSIAGWGVPAQRSFFMLLIVFISYGLGLQWSIHMALTVAALVVLLIDPWALISVGFWLSFGAMLVLVMLLKEILKADSFKDKVIFGLRSWVKMQFAVFLGLAPLLALLFNQISLISPIANAYGIFLIGTVITPASLFLALISQFEFLDGVNVFFANITHYVLFLTLELTAKLTDWNYALLDVPKLSIWLMILALFAIFNLFIATFSRWTIISLLWLIPIFLGFSSKQQIKEGEWQAYVLDVGQGSAILLKTQSHHLLFDLGPRLSYDNEATNRVIMPVLNVLGIKTLDYVVVSHSDLDHVGGFSELISQIPVAHVYASFRLDQWLSKEERIFNKDYRPINSELEAEACVAGQTFELDGVNFRFVWPNAEEILPLSAKSANEESCVLLIDGRHHNLLLTGDMDQMVENELLQNKMLSTVDAVVMPHHGSKTSSSLNFVKHVKAQVAIAQAGHYNRYNHPDKEVMARWLNAGSDTYNTVTDGAITLYSSALGLQLKTERATRKRYWHE